MVVSPPKPGISRLVRIIRSTREGPYIQNDSVTQAHFHGSASVDFHLANHAVYPWRLFWYFGTNWSRRHWGS